MRTLISPLSNLRQNFLGVLQDVYAAEQQSITALPVLIKATRNAALKNLLIAHLEQTATHIVRLERILARENISPLPRNCLGMQSVLTEGVQGVMAEAGDAALVEACLAVEQSEIVSYRTLISWANTLEVPDAVSLLELTLAEEKLAEGNLAILAGLLKSAGRR